MLPSGRLGNPLRATVLALALVMGLLFAPPTAAEAATKAPSSLTYTSSSNNAVRLKWKAVKKAAAYQVKYSTSSKLKHPKYVTTATPTIEIGKLKASKKYYFKVRALKADGKALTKFGKTKKVKTRSKKSFSALSPTALTAIANYGDELTLSWGAQGTTNRYLFRWATKKSMKGAKSLTVTGTTALLEGLKRGTPYYFTVEVRSAKNTSISQRTSVVKVTTAKLISFGTPSGVDISRVNPTDLTVSWSPVRKAPLYRVAYTASDGDTGYLFTASTTARITGLTANTGYSVTVQAADAAGQPAGEFAPSAQATTPSQLAGLRVASYNVMCHTCSAKSAGVSEPWTVRRDAVVSTINQADPDVVSLQEARQSKLSGSDVVQFNDLVSRLNTAATPWELTNSHRYNCSNPNSNSCLTDSGTAANNSFTDQGAADDVRIAYRTDRIKLLKDSSGATRQGSLLLPSAPTDNPGWVDPSPKPRYMAWAFLQQRSTGKKFLAVDVHLEPRNDSDTNPDPGCGPSTNPVCGRIRQAQAQAVSSRVAELNTEGLPVVLAGDISSSRAELGGNLPYNTILSSSLGLVDPLRLTDSSFQPYYSAQSSPAESRINIAFNSVNQYETAARCYNCRVNGTFDATRLNSYNGAYNDYILVDRRVRISEFEQVVNVDAYGNFVGVIPSDHNLIRATLWLP